MLGWTLLAWIGCDKDGEESVAACEDFLGALACGDQDWSALYDDGYCDAYADATCDMGAYWSCLHDQIVCDEDAGTFAVDPDGACASEADCLP